MDDILIRVARHGEQIKSIDKRVTIVEEQHEAFSELRVEIGKLQTQTKITWGLLLSLILSFLGIAFGVIGNLP